MNSTALTELSELAPPERILLTAHDLFYRDGIRATGIDRVIAESGVAKKTFYRYFPSKDDLIVAFLEYRHRQLDELVQRRASASWRGFAGAHSRARRVVRKRRVSRLRIHQFRGGSRRHALRMPSRSRAATSAT